MENDQWFTLSLSFVVQTHDWSAAGFTPVLADREERLRDGPKHFLGQEAAYLSQGATLS